MPNKPRADNPHRMVRVDDVLWQQAADACRILGTDRSTVMREALRAAVKKAARAQRETRA